MKVLVIAHEPDFSGGANRSLFANLRELKEQYKLDLFVLVPSKNSKLGNKLDEIGIRWTYIKYFGVIAGIRGDNKDILRYLKVKVGYYLEKIQAIRFCKKYKNEKYDLVYTNTRIPMIGANIAEILKIPHVVHVRELGAEKPMWGKWGFKAMEKKCNNIILISNALKKQFIDNGVASDKLIVLHNGIEYPSVDFYENYISKKKNINIVLVGRLVPDKGHIDAIKAVNLLKKDETFDKNVTLHIVGSLPKRMHIQWYEDELKKTVKELGLEENVVFEGELSDVKSFRENMDIELICSINETFGRVTVEAMRSGLFVIGSNTAGTLELIEDNRNGLLYIQGNCEDLYLKIKAACSKDEFFNEIRRQGYESTLNKYTVKENCNVIYNVLKNTYEKGIV